MAQKEATVFIIDLGRSMGEKRHGRSKTNLEWAMEYVWDKITTTVGTGRKTALIGVVGYRTDETNLNGALGDDEEGYSNVHVLSHPKQFLLPDIRELKTHLKPSNTNDGDVISALAAAIALIDGATSGKAGNPLKYDRQIIIVTDGKGYMDTDDLDQIIQKINDEHAKVDVTLLGVDFDDPDYGFKEEDKDPIKEQHEVVLRDFIDKCNGNFGTLAAAIDQLDIPRIKETRPVHSYRGTLTLGDIENYDDTISIDIERYPCTMIAKPPTASSFVIRTELGGGAGTSAQFTATVNADEQNGELSSVRNQRVYKVENVDEPGEKINVDLDELERGYEYGRTAVHISEGDMNVVKLETEPSFEIMGFVSEIKFDRYLPMSRTNFIVPQKGNDKAQLALSSFIHALYEAGDYAIARLVTKQLKPPIIVLLAPHIKGDFEALIDVELPFEEDMRRYKFPPLDKKLTVSGKVITEHRDIPNDSLIQAMSDYVDSMDLSTYDRDEDGEPDEYMKFEDTYSPLLHRINHIIRWRATNNVYDKLPDPPQILTKFSTPPTDLLDKATRQLDALKTAGDVKKVPPKVKGRGKRTLRDREKPLSGLDVDELLGNPKRVKIDSQNLIPSFKQALAATDDLEAIQSAADEMGKNIRTYISTSVGESGYGRALEAIRVLRDEITELEEPDIYNAFIRELKKDILDGNLKGDRRELWWRIRGSKYGLIDRKRSFASDVTEEEATEFYKG
ncbi:ATP-dependent DNA helicase-like protein II [Dendryphion nanum]|uniref:ATP-dependent DNA helicase II subunit 2 n=1 Tax=Dendryphion nanum TaxID=256645 RepID=A0A9P9EDV3_9PLEO|nr:ATP-dependent DNA helicase-like protein II [Dendryphion nanum]